MWRVALAPARSPDARKANASVSRLYMAIIGLWCPLLTWFWWSCIMLLKSYCLNCDSEEPGCVHCETKSSYVQPKVWLETSQQLLILRILPHMLQSCSAPDTKKVNLCGKCSRWWASRPGLVFLVICS
jgi:hypothetical protein